MASSEVGSTPASAEGEPKPEKEPMSVVVIGGTGAVGRCLVGVLLRGKDKFGKITVVGRRKVDSVDEQYGVNMEEEEQSGRLVRVELDMDAADDESIQRICTGAQAFFCCIGTTRKAAGSAERFHQIDYGIPLKFGKAAKAVGVSHYSLVTSFAANANSIFLYLRTKGELEAAITNLKFSFTTILRPLLLDRGAQNRRFMERISMFFLKSIPVETVAQAMAIDAYKKYSQPTPEEPTDTLILDNTGIYSTVQNEGVGSSVDPPPKPIEQPLEADKPKETAEVTAEEKKTEQEEDPEEMEKPVGQPVAGEAQEPTEKQEEGAKQDQQPGEEDAQQRTEEDTQPPTQEEPQQPAEDETQQSTEETQEPVEESQKVTDEGQPPPPAEEKVERSGEDVQQPGDQPESSSKEENETVETKEE